MYNGDSFHLQSDPEAIAKGLARGELPLCDRCHFQAAISRRPDHSPSCALIFYRILVASTEIPNTSRDSSSTWFLPKRESKP